jgi:small-conductance mechanosensitive channel
MATLAERAEATEHLLRAATADAAPYPATEAIERALASSATERRDLRAHTREVVARLESRDAIDDVERGWLGVREELAKARKVVAARLTKLEARSEELAREQATWQLTIDAARAAEAPAVVLERIRALLEEIARAKQGLDARLTTLLALQARISQEQRGALEMLDVVARARGAFRTALLRRDAPPLWDSVSDPEVQESPGVRAVLRADLTAIGIFVAERGPLLVLQGILFLLLLGVTRSIRRHAASWDASDPRAASPRIIFDRSVSAAALVTLLSTPFLHPYAPAAVFHLAILAALVPILRLMPALVGPALRPAVFAVAALVALDQTRELLGVAVMPARLVLLGSLVVAAIMVGWLLRRRPESEAGRPPLVRGLVILLRVAQLLLAVGIAATLLGWIRLGRLMFVDVVSAAYMGLAIFGALQVLRATLDIVLRSGRAQGLRLVAVHGALVRERLSRLLGVIAVVLWVAFCLSGVDLGGSFVGVVQTVLDAELTVGSITLRLGNLVSFALALTASVYVARLVRFVLEEDVLTRTRASRGVANTISATVQYALVALGFLFAVAASGIALERFTILVGALGVGVGFGLQNIVNNFVSGLILLFERPIQLGDSIAVGGVEGEVQRIGIRSSTVRTWQGAEVIVPNASLIADQVVNWTLSDRQRRMDVRVGVAYGTDPRRVIALLLDVARNHAGVLRQPAPVVLFLGFGESSLDFELRAWTASFELSPQTKSELTLAINDMLAAEHITIPFPQRDMNVRVAGDDAVRALVVGTGASEGSEPSPEAPPAVVADTPRRVRAGGDDRRS